MTSGHVGKTVRSPDAILSQYKERH